MRFGAVILLLLLSTPAWGNEVTTIPASKNLSAFLDMIAISEGTYGIGDDGYNVLFGSTAKNPKLFDGYADHPRVKTWETNDNFIKNGKREYTTAAGRYQITKTTFDRYKKLLGLKDFSPASQDLIALSLIKACKADTAIETGKFDHALSQCACVWASLPNGCGDQHENKPEFLKTSYLSLGGVAA